MTGPEGQDQYPLTRALLISIFNKAIRFTTKLRGDTKYSYITEYVAPYSRHVAEGTGLTRKERRKDIGGVITYFNNVLLECPAKRECIVDANADSVDISKYGYYKDKPIYGVRYNRVPIALLFNINTFMNMLTGREQAVMRELFPLLDEMFIGEYPLESLDIFEDIILEPMTYIYRANVEPRGAAAARINVNGNGNLMMLANVAAAAASSPAATRRRRGITWKNEVNVREFTKEPYEMAGGRARWGIKRTRRGLKKGVSRRRHRGSRN